MLYILWLYSTTVYQTRSAGSTVLCQTAINSNNNNNSTFALLLYGICNNLTYCRPFVNHFIANLHNQSMMYPCRSKLHHCVELLKHFDTPLPSTEPLLRSKTLEPSAAQKEQCALALHSQDVYTQSRECSNRNSLVVVQSWIVLHHIAYHPVFGILSCSGLQYRNLEAS